MTRRKDPKDSLSPRTRALLRLVEKVLLDEDGIRVKHMFGHRAYLSDNCNTFALLGEWGYAPKVGLDGRSEADPDAARTPAPVLILVLDKPDSDTLEAAGGARFAPKGTRLKNWTLVPEIFLNDEEELEKLLRKALAHANGRPAKVLKNMTPYLR